MEKKRKKPHRSQKRVGWDSRYDYGWDERVSLDIQLYHMKYFLTYLSRF